MINKIKGELWLKKRIGRVPGRQKENWKALIPNTGTEIVAIFMTSPIRGDLILQEGKRASPCEDQGV